MTWKYKEVDIGLDYKKLVDYYQQLISQYRNKMWTLDNRVIGAEKHEAKDIFGWGLQSNLPDINENCPPYNVSKEKIDYYRDTELIFGYIKELKEKFPNSTQWSIAGHTPNTKINLHTDSSNYLKIHIPIYTNNKAYFLFENEKIVMQPGKSYLINTRELHGTENLGDTDRIHLFFKISTNSIEEITE